MFSLLNRKLRVSMWMVCSVAIIVSACTPTGVQDPSCTADDPDEFGNIVNWCDDGSHWWIDSNTGTRYDTDASGNTTTTKTIVVKKASTTPPQPSSVSPSPSPLPQTNEPSAAPSPSRFAIDPAQSKVSYGVGETFLSEDNRYNYAVGVTTIVSGEILVDYENPAASTVGEITVDISAFQSDKSRRDKAIRDRWLQSSIFPLAVFSPTELRGLPKTYEPGEVLNIEVAGDLLVRDVIRATVFTVSVTVEGEQLTGEAVARVQMRDFGFDPPTVVGMIEAENDVDITFQFIALPAN